MESGDGTEWKWYNSKTLLEMSNGEGRRLELS